MCNALGLHFIVLQETTTDKLGFLMLLKVTEHL